MLGSFNNWNIIWLSHKATSSEDVEKINEVVLDGISDKISAMVQTGKYCAIDTTYKTKMDYNMIKFMSEAYTLQ